MKFNASEAPQEKYIKVYQDFDVGTAKVPFELGRDTRVSGNAVKLFVIYFEEALNWRGTAPKQVKRILQAEIAKRLGRSVVTVSRLTRELHNTGWATVKPTGRSNMITLHGKPKKRRSVH